VIAFVGDGEDDVHFVDAFTDERDGVVNPTAGSCRTRARLRSGVGLRRLR